MACRQILQVYPFFQDKIPDLCMQVLGQNYYLFSLYKSWRFQNRGGDDSCDWSVNDPGQIVGMSTAPDNFEISMENVDDDSNMHTDLHLSSSCLPNPEPGKYLTAFQTGDILGCTVKRNLNQSPGASTQTPYSAFMLPRPEHLVENTFLKSENRLEFNIAGHSKARNVISVRPIAGAGTSRKLLITQNKKGRVQCATVTSSEVKNRLKTAVMGDKKPTVVIRHKKPTAVKKEKKSELSAYFKNGHEKKKRKKRDPSVPPRTLNPNSLRNLIQNRGKKLPELVAAQENAKMKAARINAARLQPQKKPSRSKKLVHIKPKPTLQIVHTSVDTKIVSTKHTRQKQASSKKHIKQINKIKNKVKKSKVVNKTDKKPTDTQLDKTDKKAADPQSSRKQTTDPPSPRKQTSDPQSPRKQAIDPRSPRKQMTDPQSPRKPMTDPQSAKKQATDALSVKKPGYKQLAALQRHAGDVQNVGSTERGAKVKAQKKLNVYNEMMNKSDADISSYM